MTANKYFQGSINKHVIDGIMCNDLGVSHLLCAFTPEQPRKFAVF